MRVRKAFCILFALIFAAGTGAEAVFATPRSQVIFDWQEVLSVALRELNTFHEDEALRPITGDNPPRSSRALAIVNLAIFEAVNGVTKTYHPFTTLRWDSAEPISIKAAVRAAAAEALRGLFGTGGTELAARTPEGFAGRSEILRYEPIEDLIDRTWQSQQDHLDRQYSTAEISAGTAWGAEVARYILNTRRADGSHLPGSYEYQLDQDGNPLAGSYITDKYTPDADNPPTEPGWAAVTPFAITELAALTDQLPGPPPIDWDPGSRWMAELKEVLVLGDRRRYDPRNYAEDVLPAGLEYQRRVAFFWSQKGLAEDGSKSSAFPTVTPPGQWNGAAVRLAQEHDLNIDETARLLALLNVAGADAMIAAWKVKYDYAFWRPIHALRHGGEAVDNPVDADWIPLIPTSEHPEYVSGHSATSGAAARILALFFGTDSKQVTFYGDDALEDDRWRTFDSFRAAAEEAAMSRLYGGIHYRSANRDGLLLGELIAERVYAERFRPRRRNATRK